MAPPPPANAPDGAAARRVPASTSPTLEAEVRVAAFDRHQCDVVVREELGRGANNGAYAAAREDDDDGTCRAARAAPAQRHAAKGQRPVGAAAHAARRRDRRGARRARRVVRAPRARRVDVGALPAVRTLPARPRDRPRRHARAAERGDRARRRARRRALALPARARRGALYDLKASNVVCFGADGGVVARIIDFGRDFSEWDDEAVRAAAADARAPCIAMARALVARRWPDADAATRDAVLTHALHATMMVVLSATLTRTLHEERDRHRMGAAERLSAHPLAQPVNALLDDTRGCDLAVVRALLRHDEVRSVLRHYHGRRSAGTRRTLALARGREVP